MILATAGGPAIAVTKLRPSAQCRVKVRGVFRSQAQAPAMTSVTQEPATQSGRAAHLAFGATAILAWLGMALNLTLTALGT